MLPAPGSFFALFPPQRTLYVVNRAATSSNLGAHITTLETAGYVAVAKDFAGKRPRTRVTLTRIGRHAFEDYVAYLRDILDTGSTAA